MELPRSQLDLIQQWTEAKDQLKYWSQLETERRDAVVRELFATAKDEGTTSLDLQSNWKLKVVKKYTYNLNNKEGQVTAIQAAWPELAQQTLRWNPELNLSAFKKLDPDTQAVFNGALTIKPGKPTLELVPPSE